jgi:ornithine carbamoyltransferase
MAKTKVTRQKEQGFHASSLSASPGMDLTSKRHLISLMELGPIELSRLVDRAVEFAKGQVDSRKLLAGKVVGIYFIKPSTRTRSSFTVGALRLGAQTVSYGPNDLQLVTGESVEDTARVLSGYLDGLIIRTNGCVAEMKAWAIQDKMAVINAMSENEHPTQAIADLSTIKEKFGRLEGIHILYLGEGNNTAAALALAVAQTPGMKITFVTPEGYGLQGSFLQKAQALASQHGATIDHHHSMNDLPEKVDVVYTTRWQTMGVPHTDPNWREKFQPYCVTSDIMTRVSKFSDTIFLHDLPAVCGEDVHEEVINGEQSLAFRQARHKMFSAMAILDWCLNATRG